MILYIFAPPQEVLRKRVPFFVEILRVVATDAHPVRAVLCYMSVIFHNGSTLPGKDGESCVIVMCMSFGYDCLVKIFVFGSKDFVSLL